MLRRRYCMCVPATFVVQRATYQDVRTRTTCYWTSTCVRKLAAELLHSSWLSIQPPASSRPWCLLSFCQCSVGMDDPMPDSVGIGPVLQQHSQRHHYRGISWGGFEYQCCVYGDLEIILKVNLLYYSVAKGCIMKKNKEWVPRFPFNPFTSKNAKWCYVNCHACSRNRLGEVALYLRV